MALIIFVIRAFLWVRIRFLLGFSVFAVIQYFVYFQSLKIKQNNRNT